MDKLCSFCHRPVRDSYMILTGTEKFYHVLQDEYGNPTPKGIPSCWDKCENGSLNLEQYVERELTKEVIESPLGQHPNF